MLEYNAYYACAVNAALQFIHNYCVIIIFCHLLFTQGPSRPMGVDVGVINITATSAIIEWVVPQLVYTPETYLIRYGSNTVNRSLTVSSTDELGTTNTRYEVAVTQLIPAVNYFLEISSENTIGSASVESSFSTLEAGDISIKQPCVYCSGHKEPWGLQWLAAP